MLEGKVSMLYIERIIESTSYGMSAPIKVVADDGKVYIVKFRKDNLPGKDRSITSEYITYKLIEHFEFNHIAPQRLKLIQIDEAAIELARNADISEESLRFLLASAGTNIAIEFLEDCEKAIVDIIKNMTFIKKVRTIDNIVMNDDRTSDNTNILVDLKNNSKFYAIDWGQAFESGEVYRDIKKGEIDGMLMKYQNNNVVKRPGYIFRNYTDVATFDRKDIEDIIRDILNNMPEEWETRRGDEYIAEIIATRVQNKTIFHQI